MLSDHQPGRASLITLLFFNDTATTEIYTLSLHDALPISPRRRRRMDSGRSPAAFADDLVEVRSEEHTSELQSLTNLVCRLLLEKKKKNITHFIKQTSQTKTQNPT